MDERTRLLTGSGGPNNSHDAEAATSESRKGREDDDDDDDCFSESSCQPSGTLFNAVATLDSTQQ